MNVTLVQFAPRLNRSNLEYVLQSIDNAKNSDVVIFPELALSGYMLQDKLYEDAWRLEELEAVAQASLHVDIAIGAAIKENGRIYNAALYYSHGTLQHIHRKMYLPNYGMFEEARYFHKGNTIEAFDSALGRAVSLVCEDLWRAETFANVNTLKPDVIFLHVASPARDFQEESMLIELQWDALAKAVAILCSAYVLFVNRVGFEDGIGFWGGSRIITPKGEVEYQMEHFKEGVLSVTLNAHLHQVQKWIAKKD